MSVTRGQFLKALGKSLPGMVLGTGAAAAQKLFSKMAAAGETGTPDAGLPEPRTYARSAAAPTPAPLEIIRQGPPEGSRVALTFDDGPTPGVTDRILDELQRRGAQATFFMIGRNIAAAPELAQRVLAEGHEIAHHTFTHPKLSELSDAAAAEEIQKTFDVMASVLGHRPRWFRPPYLAFRPDQGHLVHNNGMRIVAGDVDPADWSQPGEARILGTIARDTKQGSIIICHDMYAQTANALAAILDHFEAGGFRPVTLSALLGA
jgi:peptidoglycan/xylan/chitin deacetylase (PgdA/CDA1 family)